MSGILIAGTSSDAGKSLVVTGLCRALHRRGLRIAPFKAQNMSNNSMVCADGSEIGRAQYLQAIAARVEPTSAMNPVLLKPGTDRRSFVVVRGRPGGVLESGEYATGRGHLSEAAFAAYAELEADHDLIVCEGAGSPAEINLRSGDYVNLGLARRFGLPVVLVGDIDRGGMLAAVFGTWGILGEDDRATLAAYVVNKFRGDEEILRPGLEELSRLTGLPSLGVLPWLPGVWLDGEDALDVARWRHESAVDTGRAAREDTLTVAVVRLPRISNATDVDALAYEEGVDVAVTEDPRRVLDADLAILPGTRSTLDDLAWLRSTGIADAIVARAGAGRPVLGICGGYQMLGGRIIDEAGIESPVGTVIEGLGLLPIDVSFHAEKVLGRPSGTWAGHPVTGYEIHHGLCRPSRHTADDDLEPFLDGWRRGISWGTLWHGAFENDGFRRAWLGEVARVAGSTWRPRSGTASYASRREAMIDRLADSVEEHLDVEMLLGIAARRVQQ
jgi:adenosylcobyric acid synthase